MRGMGNGSDLTVNTSTPGQTCRLGATLGRLARPGLVVVLTGPLGAGKTRLAQGVAWGLGVEESVKSPSFTLASEYEGRLPMYHLDLYRLDSHQLDGLGLEEYLETDGVTLVEWGEKAQALLPEDFLSVEIAFEPQEPGARIIKLRAYGPRSLAVQQGLEAELSRAAQNVGEDACQW
ncbi:MAG: tRNA (adenosine(37)-N6)-threonylcarbamoyltransferase complex ATPase subunit type 1 TsaE [Bacillota bacterium]